MKTVCVHDGCFQADEVLAVAVLRTVFPDIQVLRSRIPADWERADFVVDVGLKYDGARFFDHHQPEGAGIRDNGVPYAAAGLVWKHFGRAYCERLCGEGSEIGALWKKVDQCFIQGVDGIDNGAIDVRPRLFDGEQVEIPLLHFSNIISMLNPSARVEPKNLALRFERVVQFAANVLEVLARSTWEEIRRSEMIRRADTGAPVLVLEEGCAWKSVVVEEMPHIKLVVFPAVEGGWRVQTVPLRVGSFESRIALPSGWAGLEGHDLAVVTDIADAVFAHRGRFIAGARSREGALRLAELALEEAS